jgi:hypothetical protein
MSVVRRLIPWAVIGPVIFGARFAQDALLPFLSTYLLHAIVFRDFETPSQQSSFADVQKVLEQEENEARDHER